MAIAPKPAVVHGMGFVKGKRALAIARHLGGTERNCTGDPFWVRGYAVSRVGVELTQGRTDMRERKEADTDGTGTF